MEHPIAPMRDDKDTTKPDDSHEPDWLTSAQAWQALDVTDKTLKKWCTKAEQVGHPITTRKHVQDERYVYYTREDIAWLATQHSRPMRPYAASVQKSADSPGTGAPTLPDDLEAYVKALVERDIQARIDAAVRTARHDWERERRRQGADATQPRATPAGAPPFGDVQAWDDEDGEWATRSPGGYAGALGVLRDGVPRQADLRRMPPMYAVLARMGPCHGIKEATVTHAKDDGRLRPVLIGDWVVKGRRREGGKTVKYALDIRGMRRVHVLYNTPQQPSFERNAQDCLFCAYLDEHSVSPEREARFSDSVSDADLLRWVATRFSHIIVPEQARATGELGAKS
jgi:hypothetical protein